ncbi:MAG: PKD domain-containing protein [Bacteroidota bacterium]
MKLTKYLLCLPLLLVFSVKSLCQDKNDFVWILGYEPSNQNSFFGGDFIDFKSGDPQINFFNINYDMDNPICMSDSTGNLQFYSSGCNVINKQNNTMENGGELSPGYYQNYYCNTNSLGYLSYQGILSLPFPGHPNEYVLFHNRRFPQIDSIDVMFTKINMNLNNGLGAVTEKNIVLQKGLLSRTYTAVRHGNGRDWWVVVPTQASDLYYFYLLDPNGLHGPIAQQVSDSWIPGQYYNLMCTFSPDGSKFVRLGGDHPSAFRMYDFDRCSGTLSNGTSVSIPDTVVYAAWACFSPNSRYLYLTNEVERLYQYDTDAPDISASAQLIDVYDGFLSVYGLPTGLHTMAMGPDKRIYMSSANGVNILHTIHNPDERGAACNFKQHDIVMPAHSKFFLPNNPHYRLYNMPGSPCDSLGVTPPTVAFWRMEQEASQGPLERTFVDLSYFQPASWHWNFGDGVISSEASPQHTFPAPGNYEVCLTVCGASGICDTLCKDIEIITVGTDIPVTAGQLPVRVYPNPAHQKFWVSYDVKEKGAEFLLFNAMGQEVKRKSLGQGSMVEEIDAQGFPNGLYFWSIDLDGKRLASGKVILER